MGAGAASILLVDDERTLRLILAQTLRARGYAVMEAGSGAETIAAIRADPPTLLLLDAQLPDMTGWEVLRRLAAAGPFTAPTIVISAASGGRVMAEEYGFPFLEKPFALDAFLRLVAAALDPGTPAHPTGWREERWPETATSAATSAAKDGAPDGGAA